MQRLNGKTGGLVVSGVTPRTAVQSFIANPVAEAAPDIVEEYDKLEHQR